MDYVEILEKQVQDLVKINKRLKDNGGADPHKAIELFATNSEVIALTISVINDITTDDDDDDEIY